MRKIPDESKRDKQQKEEIWYGKKNEHRRDPESSTGDNGERGAPIDTEGERPSSPESSVGVQVLVTRNGEDF